METVWKLDKVLCCMFLFAILGVDPAQNPTKYKRWLYVLIQLTNRCIAIICMHVISCIINEPKTKDVQGQRPSNINLGLFVCFFDVYQPS